MKNIPVFTTPYGTASLILREIPYKQEAYVRVLASDDVVSLLEECKKFCVMVGAEHIFATATEMPADYPLHNQILIMRCDRNALDEGDAALWPVQSHTADAFKKLYNDKICSVDNASYMDDAQCKEMVKRGDGYFVHKEGKLLGIGRVYGGELLWVSSHYPGAGETVVKTLAGALQDESITLDVSSTNKKAINLYERLGFIIVGEKSRWYRIK